MQSDSTTRNTNQIMVNEGVVVLSGYGISANVEKGFLVLKDGLGVRSRERRFYKANCGIRRLIIHGTHGVISLSALKWLYDIDASIVQIGWDGEVIYSSTNSHESIALKRAQYSAMNSERGLKLAKFLMLEKINGQSWVLGIYAHHSTCLSDDENTNSLYVLNNLWSLILSAQSIPRIVEIESIAAKAYWGSLSSIPLEFRQNDIRNVPGHWTTFGTRRSLLNPTSNRNASNPANAMLNYLYALLFAETRLALIKRGFDPMAGIIHADNQYRDSFAYDVMETLRPEVDDWLLEFIQNHKFVKNDFYEKRDGNIRLTLKITPILAETISIWSEEIDSVIDNVEGILLNHKSIDEVRHHKKPRK